MNTKIFIEKAKKIHNGVYEYSKTEYVNAKTKVCIICPQHGEFWQLPHNHLQGKGCPKCKYDKLTKINTKTAKQFIEKAKEVHGDKYDYSKMEYVNDKTKICIICPIHGEFWQTPNNHLTNHGCPKCAHENTWNKRGRTTKEQFIEKAKEVHGDKYDYSKVEYVNSTTKVCIICPIHGEFWQTPKLHLHGNNCPSCSHRSKKYTIEEAISILKEKKGNTYDYSLIKKYDNNHEKLPIICAKHGIFWQSFADHVNGCGCPKCKQSHLEEITMSLLEKYNIEYVHECNKSILEWLGNQHIDFYLPKYNIAIECQGIQHFKPIKYFGGEKRFFHTKNLDIKKKNIITSHGLKIIYINYNFKKEKIENIVSKIKTEGSL